MILKSIHYCDYLGMFRNDIRIQNGIITEIGFDLQPEVSEKIYSFENTDITLLPAFTDLHTHFRDPGLTYKEDIETGSRAALNGGYTAVNLMPNTKPVCDSLERVVEVEKRIKALNLIYANQTMSMTKNLEGRDISHLDTLKDGQIFAITDDGKGVNDDQVMEAIFKIAKEKHVLILSHTETSKYSATDMRMAENAMTFRDIELCQKTQGRIHFCHVSTKEAIAAIIKAKKDGLQVSCEVTPHHIAATNAQVNGYRVNPPFRNQDDIDALIDAMKQGYVDVIATDHAPHSAEDKKNGSPGISGIETAFSLCYTHLVKTNKLSLPELLKMMSFKPSQMMGLNKGYIEVGTQADFTFVKLDEPYIIDSSNFQSKGKNTPFNGEKVFGKILKTVYKGQNMIF